MSPAMLILLGTVCALGGAIIAKLERVTKYVTQKELHLTETTIALLISLGGTVVLVIGLIKLATS
jgi:spore maturation protein SpmA